MSSSARATAGAIAGGPSGKTMVYLDPYRLALMLATLGASHDRNVAADTLLEIDDKWDRLNTNIQRLVAVFEK